MTNLERLQQRIASSELDAVLLVNSDNRFFATGFRSSAGAVVVTADKAWFITDSRYIEAATRYADGRYNVVLNTNEKTINDWIVELIKQENIKTLGGESARLSYEEFVAYEELVGMKMFGCQNMLDELRAQKSEEEIDIMRKAQEITDHAFTHILTILRPGISEQAVAAELVYSMMKEGAERMSFDPIVVSGVRSSMPHGVPSDKLIEEGDFVTMDFGCMYHGYCSDMTRTVAIGYATDEMKDVYNTVLKAQLTGISITKAGIPGKAIDQAARDVITEAGYGEYFGHGYGHCLGLEVHEPPYASPKGEALMPANCVCSAEPGIYIPGKFGVRIEDAVIIREGGHEVLAKSPKELIIVE